MMIDKQIQRLADYIYYKSYNFHKENSVDNDIDIEVVLIDNEPMEMLDLLDKDSEYLRFCKSLIDMVGKVKVSIFSVFVDIYGFEEAKNKVEEMIKFMEEVY